LRSHQRDAAEGRVGVLGNVSRRPESAADRRARGQTAPEDFAHSSFSVPEERGMGSGDRRLLEGDQLGAADYNEGNIAAPDQLVAPGLTSTFARGFITVALWGSKTEPVGVLSPEDDRNKAPGERTRESGVRGSATSGGAPGSCEPSPSYLVWISERPRLVFCRLRRNDRPRPCDSFDPNNRNGGALLDAGPKLRDDKKERASRPAAGSGSSREVQELPEVEAVQAWHWFDPVRR
jgi:hypothetical protein